MRTYHFRIPSFARLAVSEALIITFITLLCLPSAGFATTRAARRLNLKTAVAPLVGLIEVNVTNDLDNLNPAEGCDSSLN